MTVTRYDLEQMERRKREMLLRLIERKRRELDDLFYKCDCPECQTKPLAQRNNYCAAPNPWVNKPAQHSRFVRSQKLPFETK